MLARAAGRGFAARDLGGVMTRGAWLGFLSAVIGVLAVAAPAAEATFPGANGKLTWTGRGSCLPHGGLCAGAIYTGSLDGSDQRRLADGGLDGVWSPDGTHIAYTGGSQIAPGVPIGSGGVVGEGISVMDADGSNQHALLGPGVGPGGQAFLPIPVSWMPDGYHLVYEDTNGQLWETDLTGLVRTPVALGKTVNQFFKVSPDGRRIAYVAGGLRIMNFDGSADRLVTNSPVDGLGTLDWSPDGKRLMFVFVACGTTSCTPFVYAIDATGSNERQISSGSEPVWSPDGTKIGFLSATGWFTLANLDGSNQQATPLAPPGSSPLEPDHPDWQALPH
jgi:Tol biopolymer transport system component